jgi:hypothetical protein
MTFYVKGAAKSKWANPYSEKNMVGKMFITLQGIYITKPRTCKITTRIIWKSIRVFGVILKDVMWMFL